MAKHAKGIRDELGGYLPVYIAKLRVTSDSLCNAIHVVVFGLAIQCDQAGEPGRGVKERPMLGILRGICCKFHVMKRGGSQ